MAKKVGKFVLTIDVEGLKDLSGLQRQLRGLEKSANPTAKQLKSLGQSVRQVTQFTPKTISQFQQKERILKKLRQEVNVNSRQFQILGKAIDANRIKLQKFNNTAKKGAGFGKKIGTGFGSLIASQVLPGQTSSLALAGLNLAGPKGAAIGAVLGAGMDFSGLAKDAAKFAGEIKRLEVALKGVTKTQEEFAKAQKVISSVSDDLNVPIANATKQFTTLSASVIGAGGSVNDAELVFRGVSEAIKATGGDAEDVKSAIRAMSQIFGKGKVSAEELQGQLGERLPGAVVKFAQATGRTLPQLQKDLRDGTVGLNDVMKFVVKLSTDHASAARKMADSTADAGQRMQVALDKLKLSFGEFFQPVGAGIQNIITDLANMVNATITAGKMMDILEIRGGFNKRRQELVDRARKEADLLAEERGLGAFGRAKLFEERFKDLLQMEINKIQSPTITGSDLTNFMSPTGDDDGKADQKLQKKLDFIEQTRQAEEKAEEDKYNRFLDFQLLSKQITQEKFDAIKLDQQALKISEDLGINIDYVKEVLKIAKDEAGGFKEQLAKVVESALDLQTKIGDLALDVTNKLADAFADFFIEGKRGFADLAKSAIKELNRIILKAIFMKNIATPVLKFLNLNANGNVIEGGEVVPSAKGNVFARNKIVPYAYGGIVNRPTIFPMANGAGLMGEAGPEGILPLKRGKDGKLGVIAQGGGVGNIVVNVDASGTSAEGDDEQSQAFGELLGSVVRTTIIEEQRPGGLLNS